MEYTRKKEEGQPTECTRPSARVRHDSLKVIGVEDVQDALGRVCVRLVFAFVSINLRLSVYAC